MVILFWLLWSISCLRKDPYIPRLIHKPYCSIVSPYQRSDTLHEDLDLKLKDKQRRNGWVSAVWCAGGGNSCRSCYYFLCCKLYGDEREVFQRLG